MSGTHEFHQRVISDAGAAVRGLTVALGERLGLYRALAEAGPSPRPGSPSAPASPSGTRRSGCTHS